MVEETSKLNKLEDINRTQTTEVEGLSKKVTGLEQSYLTLKSDIQRDRQQLEGKIEEVAHLKDVTDTKLIKELENRIDEVARKTKKIEDT